MKHCQSHHKKTSFFESKGSVQNHFHSGTLFLASFFIFIVLPLLFVWSSSKFIHPRANVSFAQNGSDANISEMGKS